MGIYFNPGNESFLYDSSDELYVDKTGLLNVLNRKIRTPNRCIALSHARRFGKSQAAGMMDAYYSSGCDSKELFSKFEIAKSVDFEKHLNQYNVIHLDISSLEDYHKEDLVEECQLRIMKEIQEAYGSLVDTKRDIPLVLCDIFYRTRIPFIIIIDEWDCVIRNNSDRPELVHQYLQFLHSLFKSEESKRFLALGYITGILPIKKIENESALNNFQEFTMIHSDQLTPYFGFTEKEVMELCRQYGMDFASVKEWYNGYCISGEYMYNPNSVCLALSKNRLDSYWKNTSSFSTITRLIQMNYEGLKEDVISLLGRGRVPVDIECFQNDLSVIASKDDVFTALIHLGYLGYDVEEEEAYIPNYEVAKAYQSALKESGWNTVSETIARCNELLKATLCKNEERVAEILELSHESFTSVLQYNNENSLSCAVTMAYFTAPAYYTVIRELPSGKGFADIVMIPRKNSGNKPAMVIELKWDKDADSAIRQIKEKRYAGNLRDYNEKILLVGVNYEKDTKKHICKIEECRMF